MACLFCELIKEKPPLFENELAYAIFDSYPVNDGHVLIISKRHAETFFDLTKDEIKAFYDLAMKVKTYLDENFHPDGYNVGFNCYPSAGQTIPHCHMHIIPRYKGDCIRPRGGIRKVVDTPKVDY